jgi:three-Cys-motif partner protein
MAWELEQIRAEDDGLICPEIGRWAEDKYRLLHYYDKLFSTGMKNKWEQRVYIDLYAAAGYGRVRGTNIILKGSPILALSVPDPFDRYIFCEEDPKSLDALRERTKRVAPSANATFIEGSCNDQVDAIAGAIPRYSTENRVLSLCLVDPFDFGLKFSTLRRLSTSRLLDFVVLLAIGMDANRNYDHYVEGDSPKIDEALGNRDWRERWKAQGVRRSDFPTFLAREFAGSMESLGFLPQKVENMRRVRSDEKNLPLYYIALFSKHNTAYNFWEKVLKGSTDQTGFDW